MHNASDFGYSIAGQLPSAEAQAFEDGKAEWRALYVTCDILEFPSTNPYGDEYGNSAAQAFRRGFDAAAREDGYTYSRIDGEYHEGGEYETDEFPEPSDVRECA